HTTPRGDACMKQSPQVSVIVPTYQRRESVQRALTALCRQTLPPEAFEVIVVIDGSEDGTREQLAAFHAPYHLQTHWQPNQGRATACNTGIRLAQGELLILLDDDMEPVSEFIEGHVGAHQNRTRLGVMGAVPINLDASSPPVVQYIGAKFNQHLEKLNQPGYQLQLRDFYTGNFSISRAVMNEVGGFDEGFKIYGNEDLELAWRLRQAGVSLVYDPAACAYQHYTKDFRALAQDNLAKGKTAVLLASKHQSTFYELKLSRYREGSRKWRLLRRLLLLASYRSDLVSRLVLQAVALAERWRVPPLHLFYSW